MTATDNLNPPSALPEWLRRASIYTSDPLTTARALRPIIEVGAAASEQDGVITEPVLRALASSGLLGILIPSEVGGIEADAATYIDVIEELSYADSSFGWMFMATSFGTSALAGWAGPTLLKEMFEGAAGFVATGHGVPRGRAHRVDDGYRVSGRFPFGSGSQIASWFYGPFALYDGEEPVLGEHGDPELIMAIAPRSQVRLHLETWDVVGLRATSSYDFSILEQIVDEDHLLLSKRRKRRGGAIMDVGVSIAHVSWALGVAMRLVDEIKALALHRQRPGRSTLVDQPRFQSDFLKAAATLDACRSLVRTVFEDWFQEAKLGEPSIEVRARGRGAACWATEILTDVGRFAYLSAGSDGLRNDPENRIQRCFRDLYVGATHRHVDDNIRTECGSVLLGVNKPRLVL